MSRLLALLLLVLATGAAGTTSPLHAREEEAPASASADAPAEGPAHSTPHALPSPGSKVLEAPRIPVRAIEVKNSPTTTLLAAPGPAEAIGRELAGSLAGERDALHRLLGLADGGPLEIRIGHGREEFGAMQPSGSRAPGWAAGLAYPGLGLVILDSQAAARSGSIRSLLRHELAHVALARLVGVRIPNWFTEGFALLYADEWTLSRSTVLARASASKTLIPLDDLERGWPSSPSEVDLAYAQSASIVTWLASRDDGKPFHEMVRALASGTPFAESVAAAYGQPLVIQELAWRDTLSARYGWLPLFLDHELMWGWAALLVVIGAWRIRRRSRRRLAQMEEATPEEDDDPDAPWRLPVDPPAIEAPAESAEASDSEDAEGKTLLH